MRAHPEPLARSLASRARCPAQAGDWGTTCDLQLVSVGAIGISRPGCSLPAFADGPERGERATAHRHCRCDGGSLRGDGGGGGGDDENDAEQRQLARGGMAMAADVSELLTLYREAFGDADGDGDFGDGEGAPLADSSSPWFPLFVASKYMLPYRDGSSSGGGADGADEEEEKGEEELEQEETGEEYKQQEKRRRKEDNIEGKRQRKRRQKDNKQGAEGGEVGQKLERQKTQNKEDDKMRKQKQLEGEQNQYIYSLRSGRFKVEDTQPD